MATLQLENLTYQLNGARLVNNVSLELGAGECVGLVGPNGAGKSTLLRLAAGLLKPTHGQVLINGQALANIERKEIARLLGYVPQQARLDFEFSVFETVMMGRHPYQSRFQPETSHDKEVVGQALDLADIRTFAERAITSLSGGERQRVVLARALAQQPQFLLLDEPTASLDLKHQHQIMALVQRLSREENLSVLVAIHDLNLAVRYCDRLAILAGGELFASGAPDQILTATTLATVFEVEAEVEMRPLQPNFVNIRVLRALE